MFCVVAPDPDDASKFAVQSEHASEAAAQRAFRRDRGDLAIVYVDPSEWQPGKRGRALKGLQRLALADRAVVLMGEEQVS